MEEEWPEWEAALSAFSLEAALHVTLAAGRITGGEAAVRAAFHKRAYHAYPLPRDAYPDRAAYELAVLTFRRICTAYLVLKDPERRRIYCSSGFEALRHSETFQQDDVFEADALEVFESFFEGTDEADREYLLLNGTDPPSDIEVLPPSPHSLGLGLTLACRDRIGTRRRRRPTSLGRMAGKRTSLPKCSPLPVGRASRACSFKSLRHAPPSLWPVAHSSVLAPPHQLMGFGQTSFQGQPSHHLLKPQPLQMWRPHALSQMRLLTLALVLTPRPLVPLPILPSTSRPRYRETL